MSTTVAPGPRTTDPSPCHYGGRFHPPAAVFHGDRGWCTLDCQRNDAGSETTVWRQANGRVLAVTT